MGSTTCLDILLFIFLICSFLFLFPSYFRDKIPANQEDEETATFLAVPLPHRRSGFRNLSVTFSSSEVSGLVGESYVYVDA